MIISGANPNSSAARARPREVEIASAKETVRVTLSLPSDRSADRKKVLERARRMLAVALEEEKKMEKAKGQTTRVGESEPGCGAWWLF